MNTPERTFDEHDAVTVPAKDDPRRPKLPPLRTFRLWRRDPSYPENAPTIPIEQCVLYAHGLHFTESGAIGFIVVSLDEEGEPLVHIRHIFNQWLDVEEVLPASKLVH